jgi:hypothetical protein
VHDVKNNERTIYVSQLGDGTNGSSWEHAYTSIRAAFGAVPDSGGGHRIIIRPDTYMEGNLFPAFKGAKGNYNTIESDFDGSRGSGATGFAIVDASDPIKGEQAVDWWGFPRCTPDYSGIAWDRWVVRHLYVTGGDGGLFWDLPFKIEPFTITVEDSVGIGRAFGGGVGHILPREDEPIIFRRCNFWSLDWWGDTAGVYVRAENDCMPDTPDVTLQDCTLVGPQCALKSGNPGFSTYSRIKLERCRLAVHNFSQPHGTPTDGIIQSVMEGKYLHVDMESTTLMGYTVFGVRDKKETAGDIGYTAKRVNAYVQYQQEVPAGMQPLGQWPAELFRDLAPPVQKAWPESLRKDDFIVNLMVEVSPFVWKGRHTILACDRPGEGGKAEDCHLVVIDMDTSEELARFAEGHSLACAIVHDEMLHCFAARWENGTWNDVTHFWSADLVNWESQVVVKQENEALFNSSVCEGSDGFVMAYESNSRDWPAFTSKFAKSKDLMTWEKVDGAVFGTDRYAACPCIRYADGWYYQLYLEHREPRWYFETYISRSRDLLHWEQSPMNPVLTPDGLEDGVNASDPDIIEFDGKTYLYYNVGDQRTWGDVKRAIYDGPLDEFLASWFVDGCVPESGTLAADIERADSRRDWFTSAKFGMFIHWGLYAQHGKNEKGDSVSRLIEQGGMSVEDFEPYADTFNPEQFDADAIMDLAKSAGMEYVVFTSKHHGGYSMFDTELSEYSSVRRGPGVDFVRELADAARRKGLKFGLYYSWLDWHHPLYGEDLDRYVTEFAIPQVREICTNYGPLDLIWFDGEWDHPESTWHATEMVRMIRDLQPNAVINDRLGKGERGVTKLSDFYTREQPDEIDTDPGFDEKTNPWEACMTIGKSWGFGRDDVPVHSPEDVTRQLREVIGRGGNLLLNVGPTPEGTIPEWQAETLRAVGEWIRKNGMPGR